LDVDNGYGRLQDRLAGRFPDTIARAIVNTCVIRFVKLLTF
jgi:hypothetical protein